MRPSDPRHSAKDTPPSRKKFFPIGLWLALRDSPKSRDLFAQQSAKKLSSQQNTKKGKICNKLRRCCCAAAVVCSNNCFSEHVISILWIQQQSVLPGMFIFSPCRGKVFNPFFLLSLSFILKQ